MLGSVAADKTFGTELGWALLVAYGLAYLIIELRRRIIKRQQWRGYKEYLRVLFAYLNARTQDPQVDAGIYIQQCRPRYRRAFRQALAEIEGMEEPA